MIFRQLFDRVSCTYTYLVADPTSGEAAIIDPVAEHLERDLKLIDELGLKLKYVFETHVHADHVTSAGDLRARSGATCVTSEHGGVECSDVAASDGSSFEIGGLVLKAVHTPGHTPGCMSYVLTHGERTLLFSGDALLIRGCGRTDFQGGDAKSLFESVRTRLFALPAETEVYPGHDYRGQTRSSIGEEQQHNPRLNTEIQLDEFVQIMADLKLDSPKLMDIAVPANLGCGLVKS